MGPFGWSTFKIQTCGEVIMRLTKLTASNDWSWMILMILAMDSHTDSGELHLCYRASPWLLVVAHGWSIFQTKLCQAKAWNYRHFCVFWGHPLWFLSCVFNGFHEPKKILRAPRGDKVDKRISDLGHSVSEVIREQQKDDAFGMPQVYDMLRYADIYSDNLRCTIQINSTQPQPPQLHNSFANLISWCQKKKKTWAARRQAAFVRLWTSLVCSNMKQAPEDMVWQDRNHNTKSMTVHQFWRHWGMPSFTISIGLKKVPNRSFDPDHCRPSFHWHVKEVILALKSFEIDLLTAGTAGTECRVLPKMGLA